MTELITRPQANLAFGIALPLLGMLAAATLLARRRDRRLATLAGAPLVLAGALWWVYNALTDHFGLDSAGNLALNAALFLAVGVGAGLLWRRIAPSPAARPPVDGADPSTDEGGLPDPVPVGAGPRAPGGATERTVEEALEPPRSP